MDPKNAEQIREEYEPPAIENIPLHADERLLRGCKTLVPPGSGPGTGPCVSCHGTQNAS
jgi:hypothetical protein